MRRLAVVLGLGLALAGCLTPSIPIPPPSPDKMTFAVTVQGMDSTATFAYGPEDNYELATVYVFNRDRGAGIITTARADGSVGPTQPIGAAVGEQIVVSFQTEEATVSTCIKLRDGVQSATDYCD